MKRKLAIVALACTFLFPVSGWTQIVGDDVPTGTQGSWQTVSPGVMSQRAPGRMVSAGRAAFNAIHGETIQRTFSGPTITETAPTLTLDQSVRVSVLETLFTNLNAALSALNLVLSANPGPSNPPATGSSSLLSLLGNITSPI